MDITEEELENYLSSDNNIIKLIIDYDNEIKACSDFLYNKYNKNLEKSLEEETDINNKFYNNYIEKRFIILNQINISPYGIIDMLVISSDRTNKDEYCINIYLIELKKCKISYNEIGQLFRYKHALNYNYQLIKNEILKLDFFNNKKIFLNIDIYPIIIGKEIEKSGDFVFLINSLIDKNNLQIFTYNITLKNGIKFEEQNSNWDIVSDKTINLSFLKRNNNLNKLIENSIDLDNFILNYKNKD
jgi:hypothetical protein